MNTNHTNFTNPPWTFNLEMEDHQILHDQIPYNQPYTSSPQISPSNLFVSQENHQEQDNQQLGAMKEIMYKIASMQPIDIDPSTLRKPKRRNVRISNDPQSVAARLRREKISEKIRILQRLVPGGTKMDTASMLDEAINYVKFLKKQIHLLQSSSNHHTPSLEATGSLPAASGDH